MRSTNSRACRNCSGWARCVRSPERTTRLGRFRSMKSRTPSATWGRCGGPKWTSEIWKIVRTRRERLSDSGDPARMAGLLPDLLPEDLVHAARDLGGQVSGYGGKDRRTVREGEQEATGGRHRQGGQRIGPHQPVPFELLGEDLVEKVVDGRGARVVVVQEVFHCRLLHLRLRSRRRPRRLLSLDYSSSRPAPRRASRPTRNPMPAAISTDLPGLSRT